MRGPDPARSPDGGWDSQADGGTRPRQARSTTHREITMNTLSITVRRSATTALLGGAAVLAAAPAYAGVAPLDAGTDISPGQTGTQDESAYRYDSQGRSTGATTQVKAQIEHDEAIAGSPGMTAQIKAKIEAMERAQSHRRPASQSGAGSSSSSDPSSVPVTLLVLLGGGLAAGAAGYTVYR